MKTLSEIKINKDLFDEVVDTGHDRILFFYKGKQYSILKIGTKTQYIAIIGNTLELPLPQFHELMRIKVEAIDSLSKNEG